MLTSRDIIALAECLAGGGFIAGLSWYLARDAERRMRAFAKEYEDIYRLACSLLEDAEKLLERASVAITGRAQS